MSGELPEERWRPTQSVSSILLSFISLLSDPNTSSPANVDASVEWRDKRAAYTTRVQGIISKLPKVPSHVEIPHPDTDPEQKARALKKLQLMTQPMTLWDDDDEDDNDDSDMDYEDSYPSDYEQDESEEEKNHSD